MKSGRYCAKMSCMTVLKRSAVLLGILLISNGAPARPQISNETITVSRRPWFAICAGVCPNNDITVRSDGRVVAVRHHLEEPDEIERFVTRAEVAFFRSKLLPYRRSYDWPAPTCEHNVSPEEAPGVMKVTEIEITWSDSDRTGLFIACADQNAVKLLEAIQEALWAVHLYVTGHRRD